MLSFKKIVVPIMLILTLSSCKKDDTVINMYYDYFGLLQGRYIDYDVTEIIHDENASIPHDTMHYQLRTLVGDTIIDNEGRVARRFIRFKRNSSSDSWLQTDIWTAIIVDHRAELVEENQRIIKLVFPPTSKKTWNPNVFNMFEEQTSEYSNINEYVKVGQHAFDSSLVVDQENFVSMIDYRRKYEVYAKNVGMISKYYKDLKIVGFNTTNVKSGKELFYTITNYGIQ
jgi:hypothetical protein